MKRKKKVGLNNKFFWAGLGVLAVVGVVGFATELNSVANSTHEFDNVYTYKSYNVDLKSIINEEEAANAELGKPINSDLVVRNTGDIPMLVRIAYINSDKIIREEGTWSITYKIEKNADGKIIDQDGNPVKGMNFSGGTVTDEKTGSEWKVEIDNSDKFIYCDADGFYYYKGVLTSSESIQHLSGVTLNASGSQSTSGSSFRTWEQNNYSKTSSDSGWNSNSTPGDDFDTSVKKEIKEVTSPAGEDQLSLTAVIETVQAVDIKSGADLTNDTFPADIAGISALWNKLLNITPSSTE